VVAQGAVSSCDPGVPFIGSGRWCRGGEATSQVVMAVRFQSGGRLWEGW
jgi:hypothetical protein